jgi:hypothetical protein
VYIGVPYAFISIKKKKKNWMEPFMFLDLQVINICRWNYLKLIDGGVNYNP